MDDAMIMPRDHAQAYALSFPGAYAEHPWGQTVIKVKRKVFLFVNGAIAPQDGARLHVVFCSVHNCRGWFSRLRLLLGRERWRVRSHPAAAARSSPAWLHDVLLPESYRPAQVYYRPQRPHRQAPG